MGVMAEIRGALAGGATREQLEAAGYKRSSVYQAQKQLAKPGDGRRRAKVQPAVPAVRSATPALPAPSSELSDMREQVALVKLGNDLAVAKQQAVRLQPETPEPPNEITNARAMIGLFSDLKTVFPAPEPSVQPPGPGGSKLNSEQLLNLDIARMEMEERNLIREEERSLQQVAQQAELVKEVGGYVSKGLNGFLKVLSEVQAAPARRGFRQDAENRQPLELNSSSSPGGWSVDGKTWTKPVGMVPSENPVSEIALQPADRPGGTWIASADAETGEVISWAWAPNPPAETVRERLQRIGQKAAGQNSPKSGTDSIQRPKTYLRSS